MLRAPTWTTSATSTTSAMSRTSITSVTIGRPVSSFASWRRRRPSTPRPWNEYGEVRGLYAPPRSIATPASLTTRATSSVCSRLSTVQGPAIRPKCSPPTLRSSTSTTVRSPLRNCAEASLYGFRIGTRWSTPGAPSSPSEATRSRSPIAPITVSNSPLEICAEQPTCSIRSTTWPISASVASSFITIIICLSLSNPLSDTSFGSGKRRSAPGSARVGHCYGARRSSVVGVGRATRAGRLAKSPIGKPLLARGRTLAGGRKGCARSRFIVGDL